MKRVVITGMGIVSPIGNSVDSVLTSLQKECSGIRYMKEWPSVKGLRSFVAGVVEDIEPRRIHRKYRRTMGRVAQMAGLASLDAVADAGLDKEEISSETTGIAMGSTTGSSAVIEQMFGSYISTGGIREQEGTTFMKVMNHTVAANTAALLGTKGRLIAPCSACASSTQSIGAGYENIRNEYQKIMICGGSDDLHPATAGVFDILGAASKLYNETPDKTPRPFDNGRDGMVVGEGAAILVLEEYEHAKNRNAKIYGELIGYGTCCDGSHMTFPDAAGMLYCMKLALADSGVDVSALDYINAHATGTKIGDNAESKAIAELVGDKVPVSGTKGYTGHTLAASGAMEAIFCLLMMKHDFIAPTRNLKEIDPACEGITHVMEKIETPLDVVMTSNFAFGGVNAALVIKKTE